MFYLFILLKFAFIQLCVIFVAMQKKQVDKKKYMRKLYPWLLGMILGIMPCIVSASENDSIKVESLLQKAARLPADSCRILFFAQNLLGVPYVANTLDGTDEERLVVHWIRWIVPH